MKFREMAVCTDCAAFMRTALIELPSRVSFRAWGHYHHVRRFRKEEGLYVISGHRRMHTGASVCRVCKQTDFKDCRVHTYPVRLMDPLEVLSTAELE